MRGGFHPEAGEIRLDSGLEAGTLLMVGHAGSELWAPFDVARTGGSDPLDRWSREILDGVAEFLGGSAILPSDGPPYQPFQRWAMRAEPVFASPLGILIHPDFGLWHGYRGALIFADRLELPERESRASPCESCADRPCLSACPVNAFDGHAYDVPACRTYLQSDGGRACMAGSCLARRACPVGPDYRYVAEQARFHMEAFRNGLDD